MRSVAAFTLFLLLAASSQSLAAPEFSEQAQTQPTVVLLHGLARSTASMQDMAEALAEKGYHVCNIGYPSREHTIAELAAKFVAPGISHCVRDVAEPVNFVTHSLGGIIVRELARAELVQNFGRVVMLGPPNQGSEVVDVLGDWYFFGAISGPAGGELGTTQQSLPQQLGPATFQVGIIAGNRTINWINSFALIPGQDDGKVSIENAKLEKMQDFIIVPASHPFLMKDSEAIQQTLSFLATGRFAHFPPR